MESFCIFNLDSMAESNLIANLNPCALQEFVIFI